MAALSDPGALAVQGVIGPLHIVARDIRSAGSAAEPGRERRPGRDRDRLPDGRHLEPEILAAFVELLGDLFVLDPEARIDLEDFAADDVRQRFRLTVGAYLAEPPDDHTMLPPS